VTTVDVGDYATITLTVDPADATTVATATVTSPLGVASIPTTTPSVDFQTWTAVIPITLPGIWNVRWVVTGVGAGAEQSTIIASPTNPIATGQRVYATTVDLANYLHGPPPADAQRKLARASRRIDSLIRTAVYDADSVTGMPTDAKILAAVRDATCALVEWWGETGDETGAAAQMQSVSIGSVSLGRGYTGAGSATGTDQTLSAEAIDHLRSAGLLSTDVYSAGYW